MRQSSSEHLGLEQGVEELAVQELVAQAAVEAISIQAFCQGEPGSMKTVSVPLNRHQSATA